MVRAHIKVKARDILFRAIQSGLKEGYTDATEYGAFPDREELFDKQEGPSCVRSTQSLTLTRID